MATNKITLETAQEWANNWRQKQDDNVKAFLIPRQDIIDLYNNIIRDGGDDVRGYLGIKDDGEYKLMLVPVSDEGKDMIDLGIYDLSKPCPDFCDLSSPLYTLKPSNG
ncbi:MAG TPA: hypothetical protein PLP39_03665 [Flavobacterium lutivivi]|nr:hypothetical protein [Flavobacterium lutivivi]